MDAPLDLTCDLHCPVRRSMSILDGKWTLLIVRDLLAGPRRFGQLMVTLGTVTPKVLTDRLRMLEATGLVTRTVYDEMPLRVEYTLTVLGLGLRPVVDALAAWGGQLPEQEVEG
jgi:DNA-binding HxlR family transcriptional regulator